MCSLGLAVNCRDFGGNDQRMWFYRQEQQPGREMAKAEVFYQEDLDSDVFLYTHGF